MTCASPLNRKKSARKMNTWVFFWVDFPKRTLLGFERNWMNLRSRHVILTTHEAKVVSRLRCKIYLFYTVVCWQFKTLGILRCKIDRFYFLVCRESKLQNFDSSISKLKAFQRFEFRSASHIGVCVNNIDKVAITENCPFMCYCIEISAVSVKCLRSHFKIPLFSSPPRPWHLYEQRWIR